MARINSQRQQTQHSSTHAWMLLTPYTMHGFTSTKTSQWVPCCCCCCFCCQNGTSVRKTQANLRSFRRRSIKWFKWLLFEDKPTEKQTDLRDPPTGLTSSYYTEFWFAIHRNAKYNNLINLLCHGKGKDKCVSLHNSQSMERIHRESQQSATWCRAMESRETSAFQWPVWEVFLVKNLVHP